MGPRGEHTFFDSLKIFIKMFAYIRVLPYNFKEVHPFCKTCCILPLYAVQ